MLTNPVSYAYNIRLNLGHCNSVRFSLNSDAFWCNDLVLSKSPYRELM